MGLAAQIVIVIVIVAVDVIVAAPVAVAVHLNGNAPVDVIGATGNIGNVLDREHR